MSRTWVFQANPARFALDEYLATKPPVVAFLVTRFKQEIGVGDQVFLWRAIGGGNPDAAGIVAEATVIEPVALRPDDPGSRPFWENPTEADVPAERVILKINRIAGHGEVVQRQWIKEDPVLGGMLILRLANGTNYQTSTEEAYRLNTLWSNTGRNWSYTESVAGLWAYHRTYGGTVSRLAAAPVADTALLIGRAVSGVYNKIMNFRSIDPRDQRKGLTGGGATDARVWSEFYDPATGAIDDVRLSEEFHRLWDAPAQVALIKDAGADEATLDVEARHLLSLDLDTLMGRYHSTSKSRPAKPAVRSVNTREFARDPLVVAIGKVRAGFKCEVPRCLHPTFADVSNMPYCEVHHIRPLAEGGSDDPENVACLCPTHHREVHHGKGAAAIQAALSDLRNPAIGAVAQTLAEVVA
jgi:HNH endonuclease